MPTQIKINLCFNSVLGMTLNCIRWGSFGSSFHQGPVWPRVVQLVRTPTKGTSWRANARSFDLDSILCEHKYRIQTSRKSNRKTPNTSFLLRRKTQPPEVAFNATKDDDDLLEKKSVIFCWLTEITLCHELLPIRNWDQWLLKLVEKSLFFLQNTPPCRNTGQRTTASLPLPLRQTHSDQNF